MRLHSAPVEPEQQPFAIAQAPDETTKEVSLQLTIRFSKCTIGVPGGKVEFRIRRGELDLKLTNGKIPLEKMGLTTPFELRTEVEEQQETGHEAEANIAEALSAKVKTASKTAIKTKSIHSPVENRGTEEHPVWEFSMEPHLIGKLTKESLGTVERNGQPCSVEATFVVRSQTDIQLLDATGLLKAKNLSRNKTAWLTREFFLRLIEPKLQPYLSRVEGQL